MRHRLTATPLFAVLVSLTYCAPPPASPPPAPAPSPPKTPPIAASVDWRDRPLTPGVWRYRKGPAGSEAIFGAPRPDLQAAGPFTLTCISGRRTIEFATPGMAQGNKVGFRTSFGAFEITAGNTGSEHPLTAGSLPAFSPFLDQLAYSRGRFMLSLPGREPLIIPVWPEIARVIEDCRE